MAKRKIDEQISYNRLFVVLAGLFAFVTGWAVWDETVTRREWKGYQEHFFEVEEDLARANVELQEALLEPERCPDACEAKYEGRKDAAERCEELCAGAARLAELEAQTRAIVDERRGARADDIAALRAEVEARRLDEYERNQQWTFTKAEWSEQDYAMRLARQAALAAPDDEALAAAYDDQYAAWQALRDRTAEQGLVAAEAVAERKRVEAQLAELERAQEYKQLTREIETLRRPYVEATRRLQQATANKGGLLGARSAIIQYDLPRIGAVDRCTSCHLGAVRGGFEEVAEEQFRSHPFRRTLFAYHPPEEFGCTSCHDGQGRATTKFYAHAPGLDEDPHAFHTHYWERSLLTGPPGGDGTEYMEAKCRGCHAEQESLRSYILCAEDVECSALGTEQKPATCNVAKLTGAEAAERTMQTLPGTPEGAFPPVDDSRAQKVCTDRRKRPLLVDLAPNLTAGAKIVEEAGCYGCHPIPGYAQVRKPGPALVRASHKLDPRWAVAWIQKPRDHRPNTRMPHFYPELDEPQLYPYSVDVDAMRAQRLDEATAMTAFLLDQSARSERYTYSVEPIPPALTGDVARGKQRMGELGCGGCHDLPGDEANTPERVNRASHFDHGPDLRDQGAKTSREWIYSFLRRPSAYSTDTRMPNLRLTPQEALDVATYLATLKGTAELPDVARAALSDPALIARGKLLVADKGCFGCHLIEGFEQTAGIGVDLASFGVKLRERLDFGDYITDHNQQTWNNWTINKLRHPRVYSYEAQAPVQTRMPEPGLTEDEIRSVMVFLRSLRGSEDVSAQVLRQRLDEGERLREHGRKLARLFNCYGCHDLDGYRGELARLPHLSGSNAINGPPPLDSQGYRTQPAWLFQFLKTPFRMRPLPKVRMPTFGFGDDEATQLTAMFSHVDGAPYPFSDYGGVTPADRTEVVVGKALFVAFKCQLCHVVGEIGDGPLGKDVKAPNLLLGQQRLRPEWLTWFLADPAAMQKDTAMPSFWQAANPMQQFLETTPEFRAAVAELPPEAVQEYAASPQRQIEAVRNYLFRLTE